MQVSQGQCPNCSKKFCFPVEYAAEQFSVICSHCHVGYNLVKVEVDDEALGRLLLSRCLTPAWKKATSSKPLFQYLRSVATKFLFITPERPNAILCNVAHTKTPYPLAIYFHNTYYQIRAYNSLLLSLLLTIPGALILLVLGFPFVLLLIASTVAVLCLRRWVVSLPKIKGANRCRLVAEQELLQQGYKLQQAFDRVLNIRLTYDRLLKRKRTVLEQMMQTPTHYLTQIDLYQRAIKCTDDYLNLCDRAISRYRSAIRAIEIQIETSRLSNELPESFLDISQEFGLGDLQAQLERTIPPSFVEYEPNNSHN